MKLFINDVEVPVIWEEKDFEEVLKKYFPKGYSKQQMEDTIIKLLEKWHRKLEMER